MTDIVTPPQLTTDRRINERVDLLVQLADARASARQLQGELAEARREVMGTRADYTSGLLRIAVLEEKLAAFAPLVEVWTESMRGRRAYASLADWVRFEVVGPMRGREYEDAGAASQWMER